MSLFSKKILNNEELEKEIEAQKQLVENEISLYRKRRMLDMDVEIENTKLKRLKEVAELEILCHQQLAEYEHKFHSTKEERGVELAKLEAKIEILSEIGDYKDKINEAKNEEITRLVAIINSLTKTKTK